MKILIDIGHPAHVHYFKYFIKIMENKGHSFLITARDKEVSHQLLKCYNIDFKNRGKGSNKLLSKIIYTIKANLFLLYHSYYFKPDVFISFSSPYAAQVSWLLRKPHIAFSDTEHATLGIMAFVPFSKVICTPSCFKKDFSEKHIRFNGYMELCYLHPNYFTPDPHVLSILGIEMGEIYVVLRFISWKATHDIGHFGISIENKIKTVNEFSKHAKVFISSEDELPAKLKPYQLKISPDKMHDVLTFASLLYGESATMASESAMLGTPAIFLDNDGRGYTDEEEDKYGLVYNFTESLADQKKSIKKGIKLLSTEGIKEKWGRRCEKMLSDKIDVTAFMVWFVENYPKSIKIMNDNPGYQYKFQ